MEIKCQGEIVTKRTLMQYMNLNEECLDAFIENHIPRGSFIYDDFLFRIIMPEPQTTKQKHKKHKMLRLSNVEYFKKEMSSRMYSLVYVCDNESFNQEELSKYLNISITTLGRKTKNMEHFTANSKNITAKRISRTGHYYIVKDKNGEERRIDMAKEVVKLLGISFSVLKNKVEIAKFYKHRSGYEVMKAKICV